MAQWNCGARSCPGHRESSHHCTTGPWTCGRRSPACPGHGAQGDRCAADSGTQWNCGARACPTHSSREHRCSGGVFTCGRTQPACPGHSSPGHVCPADLTMSQEECTRTFGGSSATGAAERCPLEDRIVLVEIVEVVTHSGTTTTRAVATREQYINLDDRVDAANAHPEFGRKIRLKARVQWESGSTTRPLAGYNVYWYSTPGGSNKTGLTGNERDGFDSAGSATRRKSTTTDAQGWTPVVEYFLSCYGGDQFDVYATLSSSYSGGLHAGPYVVWKKFWYQVTEMQDGSGGVLNLPAAVTSAFEAGYRTVFIRFTERLPRNQASHAGNLSGSTARGNAARPHFTADVFTPFKCHIMTVDYSESGPREKTITGTMNTAAWTTPAYTLLWRHGSGSLPWKVSAQYRRANPPAWRCQRVQPACGGHSGASHRCPTAAGSTWSCGARGCPTHSNPAHTCSSGVFHCRRQRPACPGHAQASDQCPSPSGAAWTCGATGCPTHAAAGDVCGASRPWANIPDSAISTTPDPSRRGWKTITITFPAGPGAPSASNPYELRLVVREAPREAYGWGGGSHHLYLCTGLLRDDVASSSWDPIQRSDAVHEIGHALGLVNLTPTASGAHNAWADTVSSPPHPEHCRKPPSQCAMWFQSSTTRLTTFHLDAGTGCHDHLRRQDFSRSVMAGHWRD